MGNSFGKLFTITTFGESHAKSLGVIIDGCPAGLRITASDIQRQLDRRKPGQSDITTHRSEADLVEILSGVFEGESLGTPISLLVNNRDARSKDYSNLKNIYRPGHADYTYDARYGRRDWRGGGRASARETTARVAGGAIAAMMLRDLTSIRTTAWVERVYDIKATVDVSSVTSSDVESTVVRCPDLETAERMITAIKKAKKEGDSLGGQIGFKVENLVPGFGAPVFDKLSADLAKAIMSIPATRSVSFGLGERASYKTGSEHNDLFYINNSNSISTRTNNAGGLLGGISNGETLYGTVTFKPTATIGKEQTTVTSHLEETSFSAQGRHDPCVLPRAVPIVEAMINLVMADQLLLYSIATMNRIRKIFKQ